MSVIAFFLFTLIYFSSSYCSAGYQNRHRYMERNLMIALASKIGINYGRQGNDLPSPYQSINFIKSIKAGHVKLYDADPETLTLLSHTNLYVSITVHNHQITSLGTNQTTAEDWERNGQSRTCDAQNRECSQSSWHPQHQSRDIFTYGFSPVDVSTVELNVP
ncbi:hypothetical protein Rs2_48685 [Raphanus sativus]|nr:hypothetical protein Rs2_48685 [Raphanus sativus]